MINSGQSLLADTSSTLESESGFYTLITGGSQGIGLAMAKECAARGMNLLLVALDESRLYEAARDIQKEYDIIVNCYGIDLTQDNAPQKVYDWCVESNYRVNILINNAGFGRSGIFNTHSLQEYRAMMRLNNQALVEMTYHFLPMLQQSSDWRLLNMSSMEANLPIPYKAVYSGSKHFVYGFSLALREELKEHGSRVSVICPGPTITNEDGLKRIKKHGWSAKLLVKMPEEVAQIAIHQMLQGKGVIVPGRMPYLLLKISRLFSTSTKMVILGKLFRKYKHGDAG